MAWSLICPASRGIGFELTRQLLLTTTIPVVATARKDITSVKKNILSDLKDVDPSRLIVLEVDVTDEATISAAAQKAASLFPPSSNHHLHLSFCIPGILHPEKSPSQLTHSHLLQTFAINTIAPMLLSKHFSPFLPKKSTSLPSPSSPGLPPHATWLNMSARVGSTTDNRLGGWYSYRASKAGVNSFTKSLDLYLAARAGEKAMAIAYHPGTVKTGLSREFWGNVEEGKLFEVGFAVEKMLEVMRGVGIEGRGRCWDWKGGEVLP
ncbi:NAD(P)-binding protein [Mollisia scopiformis]|uniref:NAD(P)-binding protein n=1 Tax=Mollisia scopiformis TaxID=149040 RepID=A0A194XTA2_MOLSC|nr:NAD(P)-binding protein [Mollisia scopiformis]KUJ23545.1 NAD(P)-binding protein [Mollisia scopiformis]